MAHKVTILSTQFVTHDVKRYIISKPEGYSFAPGNWTHVYIDKPGLRDDKRPFTFTCKPTEKILEFTIKSYHDHNGVTHELWDSKPGTQLFISEPKGSIKYAGAGLFIAAGAGITPFLSIFRTLWETGELEGNTLLYSNKTKKDIICEHELTHYFSQRNTGLLFTLTRKSSLGYISGRITKSIVDEFCHTKPQHAYICGPRDFVHDMSEIAKQIGIEEKAIVFD